MSAADPIDPLGQVLARRLAGDERRVFVEGGWCERVPTVPLDQGVQAVARFGRACFEANLELQLRLLARDRKLAIAERALRQLSSESRLTKRLAVALAAVQDARSL